MEDAYIEKLWKDADKNNSGKLNVAELIGLLKGLNLKLNDNDLKKRLKAVDENEDKKLDLNEFKQFYNHLITERSDINEVFLMVTGNKMSFQLDEWWTFLKEIQHERITREEAETLLCQCENIQPTTTTTATNINTNTTNTNTNTNTNIMLTLKGFINYLTSEKMNSVFNSAHSVVYQDMNKPLHHYWIASSHNTYLEGHQLIGKSSALAYKIALLRGCRCVELDCWDNEENIEEPVVYHGHTLVTKVLFREVLQTVREFGFVASP